MKPRTRTLAQVIISTCLALCIMVLFSAGYGNAQDKSHLQKGANCSKPCLLAKTETATGKEVTAELQRNEEVFASVLAAVENVAQAPYLGVTIHSSYEVLQDDGAIVEFNEQRQYDIARPDKGRVEVSRSDGSQTSIYYNGKTLTAYKPGDQVYAEIAAPGTVDETIIYLVKDMKINVPLARLFLTTLPNDLDQVVKEAAYVGPSKLQGQTTDQYVLRGDDVDIQLWLTRDTRPVPRRVVINYKLAPGRPNFRADLTNWTLTPPAQPVEFEFTPSDQVEKVPFVVPKPQLAGIAAGERATQ